MFGAYGLLGTQGADRFPGLGRGDERARGAGAQRETKIARTPQPPLRFVAAVLFERVNDAVEGSRLHRKRLLVAVQEEAERRKVASRRDLETIAERVQRVWRRDRRADRCFVQPERNERTDLETNGDVRQQRVRNMRGVLLVRH